MLLCLCLHLLLLFWLLLFLRRLVFRCLPMCICRFLCMICKLKENRVVFTVQTWQRVFTDQDEWKLLWGDLIQSVHHVKVQSSLSSLISIISSDKITSHFDISSSICYCYFVLSLASLVFLLKKKNLPRIHFVYLSWRERINCGPCNNNKKIHNIFNPLAHI